jgi:hypothetical protein
MTTVRRGDFKVTCAANPACAKYGADGLYQSDQILLAGIAHFTNRSLPLYVATDDRPYVTRLFATVNPPVTIIEWPSSFPINGSSSSSSKWWHGRDDILGLVEQLTLSSSACEHFIGNRYSSWSSTVFNHRYLSNLTSSKWDTKIVPL